LSVSEVKTASEAESVTNVSASNREGDGTDGVEMSESQWIIGLPAYSNVKL